VNNLSPSTTSLPDFMKRDKQCLNAPRERLIVVNAYKCHSRLCFFITNLRIFQKYYRKGIYREH